jgi:hypothetical protein
MLGFLFRHVGVVEMLRGCLERGVLRIQADSTAELSENYPIKCNNSSCELKTPRISRNDKQRSSDAEGGGEEETMIQNTRKDFSYSYTAKERQNKIA